MARLRYEQDVNAVVRRGEELIPRILYIFLLVLTVVGGFTIFALVFAGGRWSVTPAAPESTNHRRVSTTLTPQPQKIEVEVKGLATAVNKLDDAVEKLSDATGKISSLAPQPPPMPTTPTPAMPAQVEVSGSLTLRQQPPADICAAPKESLTPKEREWRFWNCPEK